MILIPASKAILKKAASDLCASDLNEFHSMETGRDPVKVFSELDPKGCHAIMLGALVVAVGGAGRHDIWFVTTNVVHTLTPQQRKQFYRILKDHLSWVKHVHSGIHTNWVSVSNTNHIRLLTKLGATFNEGIFMSPAGFAFKQFWL